MEGKEIKTKYDEAIDILSEFNEKSTFISYEKKEDQPSSAQFVADLYLLRTNIPEMQEVQRERRKILEENYFKDTDHDYIKTFIAFNNDIWWQNRVGKNASGAIQAEAFRYDVAEENLERLCKETLAEKKLALPDTCVQTMVQYVLMGHWYNAGNCDDTAAAAFWTIITSGLPGIVFYVNNSVAQHSYVIWSPDSETWVYIDLWVPEKRVVEIQNDQALALLGAGTNAIFGRMWQNAPIEMDIEKIVKNLSDLDQEAIAKQLKTEQVMKSFTEALERYDRFAGLYPQWGDGNLDQKSADWCQQVANDGFPRLRAARSGVGRYKNMSWLET